MWYNNKADHALPAYINSIHNAMLRAEVGAAKAKDYGIITFVHPLLLTEEDLLLTSSGQMVADYGTVLILIAALGFLPSALIPYLIMERANEEKRVQMVGRQSIIRRIRFLSSNNEIALQVAGVSTATYWTAKCIVDLVIILLFIAIVSVILLAFGVPAFTANDNLRAMILILFLYCTSSISLVYCLEKLFREPSLGQLTVICLNIFIGLLTILTILLLDPMWYIDVSASSIKYSYSY